MVIYVVNENPLYTDMTFNSIRMLRQHNRSIPIRVVFVCQPDIQLDESNHYYHFLSRVDKLNVEVVRKPTLKEEEGFFIVNKFYITQQPEDSILFLDADTFIFGDVGPLFEKYTADMTACENTWVDDHNWKDEYLPMRPLNSGTVLFHNGAHRKLSDIPAVCKELRTGESPLAHWIRNEGRLHNREEMGFCVLAGRQGLSTSYFDREDAYNIRNSNELNETTARKSKIFHTYTAQWKPLYKQLCGRKMKLPKSLIRKR